MNQPFVKNRKKPKHKRNIIVDYIAYIALRMLIVVLSLFKIQTNLNIAAFLGRCLWDHYHRGRKRALDNLRASYPEKDEQWYQQIGIRSFENMTMLVIDMLFTPRIVRKSNWQNFSSYTNCEQGKWLMKQEKGLLMVTAHYANFEIMGYLLGLFDYNVYSIARPLDNRFISKYLYGVRERVGQKILDKKGVSTQMDDLVKTGSTLCFIADQDAGRKGIFVDFFGRKASTYKSIGLLALTYNIPIGIGYCRRDGNKFFFEIGINRIITPDQWADKDDPLKWVTAEYTKAIEDFIRQDPTQYWWLHRRWKHRPKDEQ